MIGMSPQFLGGGNVSNHVVDIQRWLIPFVYRLVMPSAALSIFRHPAALSSAFYSWPEPKPSAGQDSMGMTPLRSR